jgi:hypothetical protein
MTQRKAAAGQSLDRRALRGAKGAQMAGLAEKAVDKADCFV